MTSIHEIAHNYRLGVSDVRNAWIAITGVMCHPDDRIISDSQENQIFDYIVNQARCKRELIEIVVQEIKRLQTQMHQTNPPVADNVISLCKLFDVWRSLSNDTFYEF